MKYEDRDEYAFYLWIANIFGVKAWGPNCPQWKQHKLDLQKKIMNRSAQELLDIFEDFLPPETRYENRKNNG